MTMTDNDDPAPPHEVSPPDDVGVEPLEGEQAHERARRRRRSGGIGGFGAPTDPEVPRAKRRRELRRRRSLVGLSVVVMSLLSITLVLLYRASTRVGVRDDDEILPLFDDTGGPVTPGDAIHEGTSGRFAPARPVLSGAEIGGDAPVSNDNVPAGSASSLPQGPPPALDIIRAPSF
jgi:hypothetical protein